MPAYEGDRRTCSIIKRRSVLCRSSRARSSFPTTLPVRIRERVRRGRGGRASRSSNLRSINDEGDTCNAWHGWEKTARVAGWAGGMLSCSSAETGDGFQTAMPSRNGSRDCFFFGRIDCLTAIIYDAKVLFNLRSTGPAPPLATVPSHRNV